MTPQQLKKKRTAAKLTQDAAAKLLGFNSGRYVRALELGEREITPRTAKLVNLLIK